MMPSNVTSPLLSKSPTLTDHSGLLVLEGGDHSSAFTPHQKVGWRTAELWRKTGQERSSCLRKE